VLLPLAFVNVCLVGVLIASGAYGKAQPAGVVRAEGGPSALALGTASAGVVDAAQRPIEKTVGRM
jgi:hypothetical protein